MNSLPATVLSIACAFGAFWGLSVFGSPDAAKDEVFARVGIGVVSIATLIGMYIYQLFKIPAEWDGRKTREIDEIKAFFVPSVVVRWSNDLSIVKKYFGIVTRFQSGETRATANKEATEYRLECENVSGVSAHSIGYLTRVRYETENQNILTEPLSLHWATPSEKGAEMKYIEPGVAQYLSIFRVFRTGAPELSTEETIQSVTMLDRPGVYQIEAVIVSDSKKQATAVLRVEISSKDNKTYSANILDVETRSFSLDVNRIRSDSCKTLEHESGGELTAR